MADTKEIVLEAQKNTLKEIRKHYGVTMEKFADDLEVDRVSLYFYETGKRMISAKALYNLWEKYKVKPGAVVGTEKLRF